MRGSIPGARPVFFIPPFQGSTVIDSLTQGVALGWLILGLWPAIAPRRRSTEASPSARRPSTSASPQGSRPGKKGVARRTAL